MVSAYPSGAQYFYSDLDFVLLAQIVQRIVSGPLDDIQSCYKTELAQLIPLFCHQTQRNTASPEEKYMIQLLPFTQVLRQMLQFFSTAADLQTFMQLNLRGGVNRLEERIFNCSTVQTFLKRELGLPYENSQGLGWDTVPGGQFPPCGHLLSNNQFENTGFTVTMMWADRNLGLIVLLLISIVYPSDIDITIRKVRSLASDVIVIQFDQQVNYY